jgi:guanylate kinase
MARNISSCRRSEFEEMIAAHEFLEHADVFRPLLRYGEALSARELNGAGATCCSTLTCRVRLRLKQKLPEAVSIFIMPPDRKKLEWRLRKRSLDAEEVIRAGWTRPVVRLRITRNTTIFWLTTCSMNPPTN